MLQMFLGLFIIGISAACGYLGVEFFKAGWKNNHEITKKITSEEKESSDFLGWHGAPDINEAKAETRTAAEIESLMGDRYKKDLPHVREAIDHKLAKKAVEWKTTFIRWVEHDELILVSTHFTSGGLPLDWYIKPNLQDLTKIKELKLGDQITMRGIYTAKGHVVKSELVSIQQLPENK